MSGDFGFATTAAVGLLFVARTQEEDRKVTLRYPVMLASELCSTDSMRKKIRNRKKSVYPLAARSSLYIYMYRAFIGIIDLT